jgi:acyl-coenzyme A thioesterase PaaI-like protein
VLLKETALVRLFGLRIPLILFVGPRVMELDEEGCVVKIPLGWRTSNHVGSMHIGVMAAGADLAAGLNVFRAARGLGTLVPIFKDARMEFLKRADGDVLFRCGEGAKVKEAALRAMATGERVTLPVEVVATVPDLHGDEAVARFTLGLSMKRARASGR